MGPRKATMIETSRIMKLQLNFWFIVTRPTFFNGRHSLLFWMQTRIPHLWYFGWFIKLGPICLVEQLHFYRLQNRKNFFFFFRKRISNSKKKKETFLDRQKQGTEHFLRPHKTWLFSLDNHFGYLIMDWHKNGFYR